MAELPTSDASSMVQGALRVVGQLTAFVKAMNDMMERYEDLQLRVQQLTRENEEARQREEAARREAKETAEALAKLRLAHEALIIEHEVGREAFRTQEDAGREPEEAAEALAELRLAYETLIVEHELGRSALHKLQAEYDALLEGRRQIVEELGAVMSSLRTGPGSMPLSATAAKA